MKKIVLLCLMSVTSLSYVSAIAIKIPKYAHYQNPPALPADSQANWITESSGFVSSPLGINQIVAPTSNSAWATAYDGTGTTNVIQDYTRTTDSGNTWIPGVVDVNNPLSWSCISAIGGVTAWGAFWNGTTGGGYVYKTTDGVNWTKQNVFSGSSFADVVYFWDAHTGVAFGDPLGGYYEIYTTSDGGTTWTRVSKDSIPAPASGEAGLTASMAARDNVLWCGTSSGRVLKTTDFGHHWTVSAIPGGAGDYVPHMTFINEASGYAEIQDPTSGGIIWYQTADSGTTWNILAPNAGTMFQDDMVYIPNSPDILVSTGVNFNLATGSSYSLNGGRSWVLIDTNVQHTTVEFHNENVGYSGGFNITGSDGIYKFVGGFIATGVPIVKSNQFNLKLYPNPATDNLYVSFTSNNYDPINLNIYDVLGKQVLGTVYQDKTQLWLRSINLNKLSDGIYSVEVINNGNKEVQKIIVQH
jgi:photosystem II stability/assembly factor-like uncharacterized protein